MNDLFSRNLEAKSMEYCEAKVKQLVVLVSLEYQSGLLHSLYCACGFYKFGVLGYETTQAQPCCTVGTGQGLHT